MSSSGSMSSGMDTAGLLEVLRNGGSTRKEKPRGRLGPRGFLRPETGSMQATADAVDQAAKEINSNVHAIPGQGEFLGTKLETGSDREQRDDARRVYEQTIQEIAATGGLEISHKPGTMYAIIGRPDQPKKR